MNFGLIGAHADGLAMARALAESGHVLTAFAGPRAAADILRPLQTFNEVEALLARPEIELVIVADELEHRPAVLRRALQSEKHVLCVHPADVRLDVAYEAVLIQKDTRKLLLPLLPDRLMPGFLRLQQLLREGTFGTLQVIECTTGWHALAGPPGTWERSPLVRVWELLRGLGGEIQEVSALASRPGGLGEELPPLEPGEPVTINGQFARGGLFRVLVLPMPAGQPSQLVLRGETGQAELTFSADLSARSGLRVKVGEEERQEQWGTWQPWPALAQVVNARLRSAGERPPVRPALTWQDEIRCLELFDAARRSAQRGRVVSMHYGEITEESTFKGVMTAAGCGLLWLVLILVIAGIWAPWLWHGIVPLLILFLALQLLGWVVPKEKSA